MNQEGNQGQSHDEGSKGNEFQPQHNEGEAERQDQGHEGRPQSNQEEKSSSSFKVVFVEIKQRQFQIKGNVIVAAADPVNAQIKGQGQLKEKSKPSKDESRRKEGSTKIRKKLKRSKSASSFSGDSFHSKQGKSRKRKIKKTSGESTRRPHQNLARPPGKQRGRQRSVASKAPQIKQQKQMIQQAPLKGSEKASEKQINLNRRTVQQNKSQGALINTHWYNQKLGDEDFNSVDAQICDQSYNQRHSSLTNRKIIELLNQEGESMAKKIAELPILFY